MKKQRAIKHHSEAQEVCIILKIIHDGLSGIKQQLGCPIDQIMEVIEEHINHFFVQALQLDHFTLRQEAIDNEC